MSVTFHVFVGGLVSGDLDELDHEKHGYPYQLKGCPKREDDGPRVP